MKRAEMLLLDILYPNRCDCCDDRIPYDRLICDACTEMLLNQRLTYADWAASNPENPWETGNVLFSYADAARTGVLAMKDGRRGFCRFAAKLLAESLAENGSYSFVTWVPITAKRRRLQGYAHAEYLAKCIAEELQIPMRGGLIPADSGASLEQDLHFAGNRNIYSGSAFSLYFVYNAEYSMPKYGSRSYYYAMLDAGILIGTLNLAAAEHGMGCCSIGDLNFRKAEAAFHLNEYQQYLHCMIFGKPAAEK